MKFLNSESYKKGIVASVILNVLAKCLGFLNSMAIAYYFGTKSRTDIYFYCYATVGLVISYIGSLDNSVIIPEAMRIREQESAQKAKQFVNHFLYLYSGVAVLVMLLLLIDPVEVFNSISQFDHAILETNKNLIFWFIPICFLMLITQYLTNILCSYKYFTLPIIAAIINGIFSFIFLVVFHNTLDVKSIIIGLGCGYFTNICLLILLMKQQLDWDFKPRKIEFHANLWKNIRYALFGNIATFLSGYAPYYILSNFTPGIVTMFNYAKNLSEIPNQIVSNQFSSVSAIKLNELSARKEQEALNTLFVQSTRFLTFIMIPVCGILVLFSNEIVALFYQRGAFGTDSVRQTAFMLKFLSFTVVFYAVNTMVARLFMATQKLKEPIKFQVVMNALSILTLAFASYEFGIEGFISGTVAYQIVVIVCTYWLMKKYFSHIKYLQILKGIALSMLLNLLLVVAFRFIVGDEKTNIILVGIYTAAYFLLVILGNQIFHIDHVSRQFLMQAVDRFKAIINALSKEKAGA